MGAQTETELKEKKLRVEDALNATKVRHLSMELKDASAFQCCSPNFLLNPGTCRLIVVCLCGQINFVCIGTSPHVGSG